MTSSQGTTRYFFWSHQRKSAEVEQVFPVSRLSLCRKYHQNSSKCDQVPEKNLQERGLQFKGHVQRQRRRCWWSDGGLWSVIGQSMLVCLLAVSCQCWASAENGQDQRASVIQLSTCRALVDHNVIDLDRLRRGNVSLRYSFSTNSYLLMFDNSIYVKNLFSL